MPLDASRTPGAAAITAALQKTARDAYRPVWDAGAAYAEAHARTVKATDIVETMQHMVGLILAAERLNEMALEAAKVMRAALAEQMDATGATTIQTEGQTAYVSRKAAWVSIDQPILVPAEYMHEPPPAPDKRAIKAAIEAGDDVPGCSIIRPNDVQLVIRRRE